MPTNKKTISMRMKEEQRIAFSDLCRSESLSQSKMLEKVLEEWIAHKEKRVTVELCAEKGGECIDCFFYGENACTSEDFKFKNIESLGLPRCEDGYIYAVRKMSL